MSDIAPTAAPEKASFAEDLVDIWFAPSAVFARRAKSGFFAIMVVLTVAFCALYMANRGAMQGIMDAQYRKQEAAMMKANPAMTQEQLSQGRAIGEKFEVVGAVVIAPILLFGIGLAVWLVGKLFKAEGLGYGTGVMIAGWACMPRVLEGVATAVQGMILDTSKLTGPHQVKFGVGRFLDPEMNAGVLSLVGRIDLFTIWVSALLGIGIVVVGKLPREKTWTVAAAMWGVGAVPAVLQLVWGLVSG